jgi:hypothetical protein
MAGEATQRQSVVAPEVWVRKEPEQEPSAESAASAAAPAWGPGKRFLFRLSFSYILLYFFPFPLDYIPNADVAFQWYSDLTDKMVMWTGQRLFHTAITVKPNGSGDTTYNYVQVLCYLALALAAALVWSVLDRRRASYARLYEWLRIYVRFNLAAALLGYGAVKVIQSQFPAPSFSRLLRRFGDSSPMGLLWTFMGASRGYNVFAGGSEMLGGFLLTTRRTALLGALVSAGVMANVVALNFFYDVPVKLYSSHLLAMAVFLALPDLRRLADFFLLNRAVPPAVDPPLFRRRGLERGVPVFRTLLVLLAAGYSLHQAQESRKQWGDLAPKPKLYGLWEVEEMTVAGQVLPPLLTDTNRWRRVIFEYPGYVTVGGMDDKMQGYSLKPNLATRSFGLSSLKDPAWTADLAFVRSGPDLLAMRGTINGKPVQARLRRAKEDAFLLGSRGFHWINERPFNR